MVCPGPLEGVIRLAEADQAEAFTSLQERWPGQVLFQQMVELQGEQPEIKAAEAAAEELHCL